jgi:hypothetical protein
MLASSDELMRPLLRAYERAIPSRVGQALDLFS